MCTARNFVFLEAEAVVLDQKSLGISGLQMPMIASVLLSVVLAVAIYVACTFQYSRASLRAGDALFYFLEWVTPQPQMKCLDSFKPWAW